MFHLVEEIKCKTIFKIIIKKQNIKKKERKENVLKW